MQGSIKRMIISMVVYTNITYCTRQFLTFDNQFPYCCSVRNKAIKRELCLSGHIQPTGEDNNRKWMWLLTDYESYQYSPRLKHNSQQMCRQHALHCHSASIHQWASGSVWTQHLFLFSVFCLLHWSCDLTQSMLERSWGEHNVCYSN